MDKFGVAQTGSVLAKDPFMGYGLQNPLVNNVLPRSGCPDAGWVDPVNGGFGDAGSGYYNLMKTPEPGLGFTPDLSPGNGFDSTADPRMLYEGASLGMNWSQQQNQLQEATALEASLMTSTVTDLDNMDFALVSMAILNSQAKVAANESALAGITVPGADRYANETTRISQSQPIAEFASPRVVVVNTTPSVNGDFLAGLNTAVKDLPLVGNSIPLAATTMGTGDEELVGAGANVTLVNDNEDSNGGVLYRKAVHNQLTVFIDHCRKLVRDRAADEEGMKADMEQLRLAFETLSERDSSLVEECRTLRKELEELKHEIKVLKGQEAPRQRNGLLIRTFLIWSI